MATKMPVRWEMPTMKAGYTVIDLSKTGSQTSWNFAPDQDVVFIGASTTRTLDRIYVTGGHNIAVIGGKYEPTSGSSATIHMNGITGNVYIEGVHIDLRNSPPKDGIGIAGAPGYRPNVYIQNTIIDNVEGTQNGVHGDVFQRYGQLGDVKMYNVSGSSNYQGLFLNPHPGYEIRSVELENVDIVKNPGGDARTWTYYFYSPGDNAAYPTKLTNVYTTDGNVFPPPGYAEGARISGDQITFPNAAFSGHMTLGRPPGGDFVTADQIGIGYTHGSIGGGSGGGGADPAPDNAINGTAGNDVLRATANEEAIDGRGGFDWVNYSQSTAAVTVNLTSGNHTGGAASGDELRNIEAVRGSARADALTGSNAANTLSGNGGNDTLNGRGGNDRLCGGAGNDTFVMTRGDSGRDTIVDFDAGVGAGDRLDLRSHGFTSLADVRAAANQSGANTVLTLASGESVVLNGVSVSQLAADDFIFVPAATMRSAATVNWLPSQYKNLTLTGTEGISGAGNDMSNVVTGNEADNWLLGARGADVLDGRDGFDWVNYFESASGVRINLAAGTGRGGSAQGDTLRNIEAIRGSAHRDSLIGDGKANQIEGGDGNDSISGRGGNDTLTGGAGNDVFGFWTGYGADTVTDFRGGAGAGDVLLINSPGIDSFADVRARMTQVGADTVINLGNGDSVKLLNVSSLSMAADDFTFG